MADDILTRLRETARLSDTAWGVDVCIEAADDIERLRELCYEAQAFIDHDKNCAVVMGRMNNCDCGYDELWRKLNV